MSTIMNMPALRQILRSSVLIVIALLVTGPSALALTSSDLKSVIENTSFYDPNSEIQTCGGGSSSSLTGSDGIEKAFNYFKDKGLSDTVNAAVVGNLQQESSLNPTIMEIGGNSQNPNDAGSKGWGIAQWTPGSKIIGIAAGLNIKGPIYELSTQLDIVYAEMTGTAPTGYKNVLGGMQDMTDIANATEFFRKNFEGGTPGNRLEYAKQILDKYGSGGAGSSGSGAAVVGTNASCGSTGAVDCKGSSSTSTLSQTRQNVVCIARAELALWQSGKLKTGGSPPYAFYKYSQGRNEEWCADFISWVYNQAGYPLSGAKDGNVASVQGVWDIGKKGGKFVYHAAGSYIPVPGDIIIHTNGESHVNMVVSVNKNASTMTTIGGNQDGTSTANQTSKVSQYDIHGFSGVNGITGYVSPTQ